MDVLAHWGFGTAAVERVAIGATNETWRAELGDTTRFLRKYRSTDSVAVQREHTLIRYVSASGIATPAPIETATGQTFLTHAGSLYALFAPALGRQLESEELGTAHAESAGRFLAELHRATARLTDTGLRTLTLRWDGPQWADRVRATSELVPRRPQSDVDRWALRRSLEQAEWLADSACMHAYTPSADVQVIHGDYQHANLFFTETSVTGVIDWDTAAIATRGFEVVTACWFMFNLDVDRSSAFLSGYRQVVDLSVDELDDGARAWGCFADHHVWPIEEVYRHDNRAAERFIPHQPFRPFEQLWASARLAG